MLFGRRLIALCGFAMLAVSANAQPSEAEHLKRALALVEAYRSSLDLLTDLADDLTPLRRLRAAAPALASLTDPGVSDDLLARYAPKDRNGRPLTGEAELNAVERFRYLMADVASGAGSMERCIAAIDTLEAQAGGFVFLPIGHALLANRFLPAPVVAGGLRAADLIGRPATLSLQEINELQSALAAAVSFREIERRSAMACHEIVARYTDIRLRDDADVQFIIRLDARIARTQIRLLQ